MKILSRFDFARLIGLQKQLKKDNDRKVEHDLILRLLYRLHFPKIENEIDRMAVNLFVGGQQTGD